MQTEERNRAEQNADGYAETMLELYRAYVALDGGAETATADGDEYTDADDLRERVQESALDVQVRGPWHSPGDEDGQKADEFSVLLTTGGPALRIVGDLNYFGEPDADSARMQVQDWGTPWTDYRPEAASADDWDEALAWWLGCFYFG